MSLRKCLPLPQFPQLQRESQPLGTVWQCCLTSGAWAEPPLSAKPCYGWGGEWRRNSQFPELSF